MKQPAASDSGVPGFTLVELLLVLAIIAAVTGAFAVGWDRGGQGRSLRAGQALVAGMMASARSHAALVQADVLLVVDVEDPSKDSFLRALRLFCVEPAPTGRWLGVTAQLPPDVCLVPPPEVALGGVTFAESWPASAGSTVLLENDADLPTGYRKVARFQGTGRVSSAAGTVMLTHPVWQAGQRHFHQAEMAAVLAFSRYGVLTPSNP